MKHTHTQTACWVALRWRGWGAGGLRLFAVCLCSNISFMRSFAKTLCVVHFGPVCRADGRGGRLVVFFDFIFQHRPALLIIKPDYENILKSEHAVTNSNINKEIWQKGHRKALCQCSRKQRRRQMNWGLLWHYLSIIHLSIPGERTIMGVWRLLFVNQLRVFTLKVDLLVIWLWLG